jgi:hypothetical protein
MVVNILKNWTDALKNWTEKKLIISSHFFFVLLIKIVFDAFLDGLDVLDGFAVCNL